jgi:hypothetical protein
MGNLQGIGEQIELQWVAILSDTGNASLFGITSATVTIVG